MNAVEFVGVSKRFVLHHERHLSLRSTIVDRIRGVYTTETFAALTHLTFEIPSGQTIGIVGSNGSGKSTILKLIARILGPTEGTVNINGSVSALLELGAGFHPEFTGRENLYLFGAFQGLSRRQVDRYYAEIVDFSELGHFVEQPIKHYSSGMYLRLAFAAAIVLDPEILLIDEALGVGDEHFQRKCVERLERLRHSGKTLLLVSHDLSLIREFCTRVLWLERGECQADGLPGEVVDQYLRAVADNGQPGPESPLATVGRLWTI